MEAPGHVPSVPSPKSGTAPGRDDAKLVLVSCLISTTSCTCAFVSETTCPFMFYSESDWCVVGVNASAALSKSRGGYIGLVSVFCCLLRQLPWQGENEHRSTRSRWRNVQGWSICPSIPRLVFPYLIYVCSRYWSLDTAAAPSVRRQNGRRVNH